MFAQSHFRSSLGMLIRALEDGFGIGLSGEQDVVEERKHENPERNLANKVEDVRISLKEFGVTKLLKKNEEPKYHKKIVIAHPDDELDVLYGAGLAGRLMLGTIPYFSKRATYSLRAYCSPRSE